MLNLCYQGTEEEWSYRQQRRKEMEVSKKRDEDRKEGIEEKKRKRKKEKGYAQNMENGKYIRKMFTEEESKEETKIGNNHTRRKGRKSKERRMRRETNTKN